MYCSRSRHWMNNRSHKIPHVLFRAATCGTSCSLRKRPDAILCSHPTTHTLTPTPTHSRPPIKRKCSCSQLKYLRILYLRPLPNLQLSTLNLQPITFPTLP